MSLFAAEFDYFRIPREKWELMVVRVTQMGTRSIYVTIPWCFHEVERGSIDFNGRANSRHDLIGLLDLCQKLDLSCILNLGPLTDAAVLNNGLPTWLPLDSKEPAVINWFTFASEHLAAYQQPSGPVVALQVDTDDALAGDNLALSADLTDVRWPIWLRKRYGSIEAVNAAYGASYGHVSHVKFPSGWSQESTPLQKDAKTFLAENQREKRESYRKILIEAGWKVLIYPPAEEASVSLPTLHTIRLTDLNNFDQRQFSGDLIVLKQPIQVDPDPADIGSYPSWADDAPIRADGTLQRKFWSIRNRLWQQEQFEIGNQNGATTIFWETGGIVTSAQDRLVKIELPKGTKPAIYRLRLNGELVLDENLKVFRSKLRGTYLAEDDTEQTDLVFLVNDPTNPLEGFMLNYLSILMKIQLQTLLNCAALAEELGQTLMPPKVAEPTSRRSAEPTSSYTLEEARRGLKEADAMLRKAIQSIGGVEAGFGTILGRATRETEAATPAPAVVRPEAFKGEARDILVETGRICTATASELKTVAEVLQHALDASQPLTVADYQQSYTKVVTATHQSHRALLEIIAQLRLKIASEQLPLVSWRVHDSIQSIAEGLRWGILKGS